MADAGFRLTVEGEREFREALKAINEQIKTNTSELKMLAEQYKIAESPMESLQAKQESLTMAMDLQAQKSQAIADEIKKVSDIYGENDSRVQTLIQSYNASQAQLAKLTGEYRATTETIENAQKAMENMADMQQVIDDTTEDFAAAVKSANEQVELFESSLGKADNAAGNSKVKIEQLDKTYDGLTESIEKQKKNIATLTDNLQKAEKAFGKSADETKEYREQLDKATKALDDMEQAAEDNRKAVEKIGENNGGMDSMLDVVEKISDIIGIDIPDGIKNMIGSESDGGFLGAGVAAAGIGTGLIAAGGKITEIFKETIDWADELTTKAQEMNIGTESYQSLEYAATKLGVSMDTIQDAIKEINSRAGETDKVVKGQIGNILEFSNATDEQKKAVYEAMKQWDDLGVSIYDTVTGELRPADKVLYDLIDSFGKISNTTERAYKMSDMFGESYRKLNPLIEAGTDELRKYEDQARKAGIVMEEETIASLDKAAMKFDEFSLRVSAAFKNVVANVFDRGLFGQSAVGGLLGGVEDIFEVIKNLFAGNAYADGTSFALGGWSLVGERGPEIVHLPRGSQVFPNGVIPNMDAATENNVYNITISARDVQEFNDIIRIAQGQKQSIRMGYAGR